MTATKLKEPKYEEEVAGSYSRLNWSLTSNKVLMFFPFVHGKWTTRTCPLHGIARYPSSEFVEKLYELTIIRHISRRDAPVLVHATFRKRRFISLVMHRFEYLQLCEESFIRAATRMALAERSEGVEERRDQPYQRSRNFDEFDRLPGRVPQLLHDVSGNNGRASRNANLT